MIHRIATDENFDGAILRGIQRRYPLIDVIRIQDTVLSGKQDQHVLEWITQESRILLTHDKRTMPDFFYNLIYKGHLVRGIFVIDTKAPVGLVIEQLSIILGASSLEEWDNLATFLPFS